MCLPIPDRISFLHWYHQQFQRFVVMYQLRVDIVVEYMVKYNVTAVDNNCIADCPIFDRKRMQQPYKLQLQKTTWFSLSRCYYFCCEIVWYLSVHVYNGYHDISVNYWCSIDFLYLALCFVCVVVRSITICMFVYRTVWKSRTVTFYWLCTPAFQVNVYT